jgi:SAM-dependent methyltransferase
MADSGAVGGGDRRLMFSLAQLNALRGAEIERVVAWFAPGARVLELGAGTGQQSRELAARGFVVEAVELPDSNYAGDRLFRVTEYDGRHIPFPDRSFDIVYSSNVLEHVPDLGQMHKEIRRVLRTDGRAVHVLPTHAWRFWTTISAFPTGVQYAATLRSQLRPRWPPSLSDARRLTGAGLQAGRHLASAFRQRRHGERGNLMTETWLFLPEWWRRNFRRNGFEILRDEPMGLFYTGNMVFGTRWSLRTRSRLARVLGSACHIFELRAIGD